VADAAATKRSLCDTHHLVAQRGGLLEQLLDSGRSSRDDQRSVERRISIFRSGPQTIRPR
jgi:hypothetical protein